MLPYNGLPQRICEKCKCRLETLERAAEDLENFHSPASASYETLLVLVAMNKLKQLIVPRQCLICAHLFEQCLLVRANVAGYLLGLCFASGVSL